MARTFIVNTIEDPTTLVTRARQAASNGGAQFRGNETSGSFSGGGIRGIYRIQAGTVAVTITDKPWVIPWGVVESRVKRFFQ